jgi:hypothetical protein
VQDVQSAELLHCAADCGLQTCLVGYVGADCDRAVAGEMRGLFAGCAADLRDRNASAFAREQDSRCATNAGPGTGDECHLAIEPSHCRSLRNCTPLSHSAGAGAKF